MSTEKEIEVRQMANGFYYVKIEGLFFPKIAYLHSGVWWYGFTKPNVEFVIHHAHLQSPINLT